jgi:hypothetical protein
MKNHLSNIIPNARKLFSTAFSLALLWCFSAPLAQAAATFTPIAIGTSGAPQGYWEFLPSAYTANPTQKLPVVIYLHGLGEGGAGTVGTELNRILVNEVAKNLNIPADPVRVFLDQQGAIVLCPQIPSGNWWGNVAVRNFLNYTLTHYQGRIDVRRIYLTGLSSGSLGVTDFMNVDANAEDMTAGVVCAYRGALPNAATLELVKRVPYWALTSRGDLGDQMATDVTSMATSIKGSQAPNPLTNYPGNTVVYSAKFSPASGWTWVTGVDPADGVNPKLTYFVGSDHNSWNATYNSINMWTWMLAQQKPDVTIISPSSGLSVPFGSVVQLTATATDKDGAALTGTSVQWTSSLNGALGSGTSLSVNNLNVGSHTITCRVVDGKYRGNRAKVQITVTNGSGDTTAPTVTITSPTSATTYATTAATVNLAGTASDNVGVTQVTWVNDRGGSGTASGTTGWSVSSIALQSGANVITVTAKDAANNSSTDVLTVTYSPADTTAPTVTITGPTNAATYSTSSSTVNLSGTASDNVGVTQVTWVNDRGGSGTASGTTSWSANNIALQSGANVITVTAKDAANNSSTDVLTVTSSTGSPVLQVIPVTAGAATGSAYFPLQLAFDAQPTSPPTVGQLGTGGAFGSNPNGYAGRQGYIDFGPNFADITITEAWTAYWSWTSYNGSAPFASLWWSSSTDNVFNAGTDIAETRFNFGTQAATVGAQALWTRDATGLSIHPAARYLIVSTPASATFGLDRVTELAFVGYTTPLPPSVVAAVNVGGAAFTATDGTVYAADAYFTGGSTYTGGQSAINGTTDDLLYQNYRVGMSGYAIPVPNGTYTVTLQFCENAPYNVVGSRVFNVSIEGAAALTNFDIYAQAGTYTALDKTFQVTVSDGTLNIGFTNVAGSAAISAILVETP